MTKGKEAEGLRVAAANALFALGYHLVLSPIKDKLGPSPNQSNGKREKS